MNKDRKIRLAKERITILFEKAEKSDSPIAAQKYIRKAKRTAMHFNIKLPRELRKKFCRKCCSFFTLENCKRRIKHKFLVLKCLNCNTYNRFKIS